MSRFIEVTYYGGNSIIMNTNCIERVFKDHNITVIAYRKISSQDLGFMQVEESYAELKSLLQACRI